VNDELERIWKEAVVAQFKVIISAFAWMAGPRFEPGTSRIKTIPRRSAYLILRLKISETTGLQLHSPIRLYGVVVVHTQQAGVAQLV
jgi:formamidopyrimidine-DNA glycosylase